MTISPEIVLPPLPKPWTAASTLKCVSCGAPYEPARALAPHASIGLFGGAMSSSTCKCGSSTFGGSFGYDSPSPAQFTADQMNEHYLAGYEAGRASVADRGVQAVPGEPVAWQVWWGMIEMRPHWPPFKSRIEAYARASSIKSNTEVRPLYAASVASRAGKSFSERMKELSDSPVHRANMAAEKAQADAAIAVASPAAPASPVVPVTVVDEAKERAAFEPWMSAEGYGCPPRICSIGSPREGEYADLNWHRSWEAWIAAKRLDASRLSLLTKLAKHRGFDSVAKALAALPLNSNESNGDGNVAEALRNLQTWLVCGTIGTALKPDVETVRVWIDSLEATLAAAPASPSVVQAEPSELVIPRGKYRLVPVEPRPDCCNRGLDKHGRASGECCGGGNCAHDADVKRAEESWIAATLPSTSKAEGEGKQS